MILLHEYDTGAAMLINPRHIVGFKSDKNFTLMNLIGFSSAIKIQETITGIKELLDKEEGEGVK